MEIEQLHNQIASFREEIKNEQILAQQTIENQILAAHDAKTKIDAELAKAENALEIAKKEQSDVIFSKQQLEQILEQENEFLTKYQTQLNPDASSQADIVEANKVADNSRELVKAKSENLDRRKLHQQAAQEKLEDLRRQIQLMRTNLTEAQEKIETPSEELNVMASDSHFLLKKIAELKEKVIEAEKAVIGAKSSGDNEKIDVTSMKFELAKALLTGAQEETIKMNKDRDQAGKGVGEMSDQLEDIKSNLNKKEAEFEHAETISNDSKLAVSEADKIYKSSQLDLEKAENILKEKESLLEHSSERISGIESQISDTQAKIQKAEESLKEYEPNLEQTNQKIIQHEDAIKRVQEELEQALKGITEAETHKANL